MQWYFALTEDSTAFRQYAEMIMVAVHTARKVTSLEPHCLYDGGENDFTEWLRKRGVRIVRHRSFVREALEELGRKKGNPHLAAALSGAFSRIELPEIVERTSGTDRILYTDCDVMFRGEVVPELEANACRYFAVAPESVRDDYVNMNTGVMLMNIDRLRESLGEFREYVSRNLASLEAESWDEAAYRWFYRDDNGPMWDRLRPELNWKPYWGDNAEAKIVHFHGPKPYQREYIDSHWPELKEHTGGAYFAEVERWSKLLEEAKDSRSFIRDRE
jgi:lipopolysaccharide biosynthesis glycosyltransferase